MMTRLRGGSVNGFRTSTLPNYSSPSPPIYPTERKIKKPLMEKYRRERMNHSMNVLKERIIHAHPHESSKLEKADILEKTVLYVNELESQMEVQRREKLITFQQGYLQACHELVELIVQHQSVLQASNPTELKQKLRQTVERHLKTKCTMDPQSSVQQMNTTTINPGLHNAMQFAPNRMTPPTLQRPIHSMPPPFIIPPQFAALNYLNRLPHMPIQPTTTTSSSLFPFPTPNMNLPRPVPRTSTIETVKPIKDSKKDTEPMAIDEEIDVERVEDEDDGKRIGDHNTTEDSGLSESPPISAKSCGSEVWRPF